jgi:hypothetical protein
VRGRRLDAGRDADGVGVVGIEVADQMSTLWVAGAVAARADADPVEVVDDDQILRAGVPAVVLQLPPG